MSKPGHITRKETATKKARELARKEQITFRQAIYKTQYPDQPNDHALFVEVPGVESSRKAKKRTGNEGGDVQLGRRGKFYHSAAKQTDIDIETDLVQEWIFEVSRGVPYYPESLRRSHQPMVISLADVKTHIAKPKGIRKEYEWVDEVKPVIALDDDQLESVFQEDEEWEDIYFGHQELRRPYAIAASGEGGG